MSNLYTRIIKVVLVSYLFINAAIWTLSPTLVNHYLSEFLASKSLILSENSTVRYNPFISQIHITDFSIHVEPTLPINGVLISIPSATVEFSLLKFFAKKVVVEKFDVNGLQTDIGLAIVHFNSLPPEVIKEITPSEQLESQSQDTDEKRLTENWFMTLNYEMPLVNITNSKVLFDLAGDEQSVEINQLKISDVLMSKKSQSGKLAIGLLYNEALFEFDASLKLNNGVGEFQYSLDLQELNLNKLAAVILNPLNSPYTNINGFLSIKAKQDITFNKADISSQIQDINLLLSDLSLSQGDKLGMSFNIAELAIKEGMVDVSLSHSLVSLFSQFQPQAIMNDLTLRSNLSLEQSDLLISLVNAPQTTNTELVKVSKLNIPDIDIVLKNNEGLLQTKRVVLDNITIVDTQSMTDIDHQENLTELPLLHILTLSFEDIQVTNNSLKVGNVDITKINAVITKQKDGKVAQLAPILASAADTEIPKQTDKTKVEPLKTEVDIIPVAADVDVFNLYVGKVNLLDKLSLSITDNSVTPSYQNVIYINSFTLEPIDNSTPSVSSKVMISGTLDHYSKFVIDADVKPFSKENYMKADVTITEFDLSTITTYLKDIMAIESGHLNTVTNFIINGDVIKGNSKLNLLRVELAQAVEYDQDNSIDTLIPINVALSMLKDGQGNIELDVPVEGSLDAPDFRLSGFMALLVQRATMSATKKYLINAFVPYANIVQIGMQAGEFILKVRFQDLILTTGEDELPKSASIFLEQFAALMLDKKSTQITICAMSTKSDIGVGPLDKLTTKQLDKLNQLSLNRMKNFKNYMVDIHNIESARLLLCSPKIDIKKDAKPRLIFTN